MIRDLIIIQVVSYFFFKIKWKKILRGPLILSTSVYPIYNIRFYRNYKVIGFSL